MKKLKHRTLGWIATEFKSYYKISHDIEGIMEFTSVVRELIENSSDREEIVEEDWIDYFIDTLEDWDFEDKCSRANLRVYIEQHAPKQKKFTIDDLKKYQKDKRDFNDTYYHLLIFCKDNGLLSSEYE